MPNKTESHPMVSVIIPVKNGGDTIKDLLDSLMQADYPQDKLEIIVIDGHSTDNTREIVSQYNFKLLMEERRGINAARNTGIKHCKGKIIAFTDSDCVVPPDWIKLIVQNFQDEKVGCVGGSTKGHYDNLLSKYSDESLVPVLRRFDKREVLDAVKPPLKYPAGCNMAIRRDVVESVGLFDENIMYGFDEDELVERICEEGNKMVLDKNVLIMHKHRSSLSELLRLNFKYGRGIALLPKTKGIKSTFSKWIFLCVLGMIFWFSLIFSLIISALLTGSLWPLVGLVTVLLLPPVGLAWFYVYQNLKKGNKDFGNMIIYPFIDIARAFAFMFGSIYQLLKPHRKKSKPMV